jgi:hypothetical protein
MNLREKLRSRWQLFTVLVVALVLAIGVGPSVASHLKVRSSDIVNGQVKTPDLHNNDVTSKKLHQGAVTGRTIRDHGVGRADLGRHAITAQAYVSINGDGTVDESRSMHIGDANLSHPMTGHYCVRDLPFVPRVATPALSGPGLDIAVVPNPDFICPGGTQLLIRVFSNNGSAYDAAYSLVVF